MKSLIFLLFQMFIIVILVFIKNVVFLFNIHPIVLILVAIAFIVGKIMLNEDDYFKTAIGTGVIACIIIFVLEIVAFDNVVLPDIMIRLCDSIVDTIREFHEFNDDDILVSIIPKALLAISEAIVIGTVLPAVFSGVVNFPKLIYKINDIRREKFKEKYFDTCKDKILNSKIPLSEIEVLEAIPQKINYNLADVLLNELKKATHFNDEGNLYWGKDEYDKMNQSVGDSLRNTTPKSKEWIINNVSGYNATQYTVFKVEAIKDFIQNKTFIIKSDLYWRKDEYDKMKQSIEDSLRNTLPKSKEEIINNVSAYDAKQYTPFKYSAIENLIQNKTFIKKSDLYWTKYDYDKMKQIIEDSLRNTFPKSKEWFVNNIIGYNGYQYTPFKYSAIKNLVQNNIFISEGDLYWRKDEYNKMKQIIEDYLRNTFPKSKEEIINNVAGYNANEYTPFKSTAIYDLIAHEIFIVEREFPALENGKKITLYRHRDGRGIETNYIEDDPDFY